MARRAQDEPEPLEFGTRVIGELMQFLVLMRPLRETLNFIAQRVSETLSFKYATVLLPQSDWTQMQIEGAFGLDDRYIYEVNQRRKPRLSSGLTAEGPSTRAYKSKKPVTIPEVRKDPNFSPWLSLAEEYGYRSLVSIPMLLRGEPIGALNCYSAVPREYSAAECDVLQIIASQAALAIELARLLLEQRQTIIQLQESTTALRAQQATVDRVTLIRQRLMQLVFSGSGFAAIADTLALMLRSPLLIWDRSGRSLGYAIPPGMDELRAETERWETWIHHPSIGARLHSLGGDRGTARALANLSEGRDRPITFVPILVGRELMAYLGMVELDNGTEDWRDQGLRQGADILALELLKENAVSETETRLKAEFAHSLLLGQGGDRDRLTQRARTYGLDLTSQYFLVLIDLDHDQVAAAERKAASVSTQIPGGFSTSVDGHVAIMFPAPNTAAGFTTCQGAVHALEQVLHQSAAAPTVFAVFSAPCQRLEDLSSAYLETKAALIMARKLGLKERILRVERLGMFRALLRIPNPADLIDTAANILRPLTARNQRSLEIYTTLCAYLDHSLDVHACVEQLGVHPNTIRYRLRKVEELTGLSLGRPHDVLQLTFAVLIHKLFEENSPGEDPLGPHDPGIK